MDQANARPALTDALTRLIQKRDFFAQSGVTLASGLGRISQMLFSDLRADGIFTSDAGAVKAAPTNAERNRIYNAVKLLPGFILLMSPLFTLNRYLLQFYAARTQRGLPARFMKDYSWIGLCSVLARAYAMGLVKLPEIIRKRRAIARTRRLTVDEWYRLISRFKLDAIELALKY